MQSSSSSSLDRPKMNYDVFISFRGRDVRHTFAGYLYDALNRLGIKAFLDNKRFLIGDDLHSLFQIIDESRSAIVILSEDYASAKWCLRELTKIMDSMGTTMDRVLPVFYHIDPSIVKDQSGTFKTSFDEHEVNALKEIDNQEKETRLKEIQNWKNAMKKIGNRTGVVITKNSSEVDIVNKIANQIFDVWRPKLEALNKNLVGMKSRLLHMNMHLGLGLDDVRFVAVVGMGGIGKTTIAQVVFDCIFSKFDDCCFLTLLGGDSKQSLVSLQREMLSQIFHKEDFRIWHENHGVEMIKNRLSGRKVLLVLDGVEERRQLEMLAGSTEWFGPGSRVIITTRNKGLLNHPNYDEMKEYNVEELDHDSALQLFLKHAFGRNHQNNESFMDLSNEIVEKAKRLPLALRVVGSFLYGSEIAIWRETLERLIKVDERSFFDVLKISYDGLGVESQQVFLDITCFFNGKNEDRVIEILESFGYSPKSEIQLLMQRCLIEISHKKILVHDLILEMGREIVRKESLTQPEKHSRIWLHEDLYCKFAEKYDLMHIQGIVLNLDKEMEESIELDAESFSEMTKLRILEINNVELSEDIEYLSQLLRIINWPGYPSKSLPPTFQSRYLFELLLPHSHILRLWDGKKRFPKLKVIDVSNSEHLRVTPDFSGVPNLERLVLSNCVRLCEIHPSINSLNKLILLDLQGCGDLKHFPPNIRCKNLQTLKLSGTGLETSPEIGGNMAHLTHLHLDESNITQLHPSIEHLTGLALLDLSSCVGLCRLPCEIGNLKSLKILLLKYCTKLDQIPPSLANAESLKTLSISETSITHVPSSLIHCLKNLETLDCEGLSGGIWKSLLPQFNIHQTISTGLGCLKTLNLMGCKLMDADIPEDLHCFSSLETLDLSYNNFTTLPDSLSHLNKLKTLYLNCCTELKDLPKLPESLQYVGGIDCRSISEQYYNKILLIPSSSGHQLYLNFVIRSKDMNIECALDKFQHSIFTRRSFELKFIAEKASTIIHEEVDMLEWFDLINEGNWINIQYERELSINKPLNIMYEDVDLSNVCGVFLSTNIEFQQNLDHLAFGRFSVSFEIDGKCSGGTMNYEMSQFKATRFFWVVYIPIWMFKHHNLMVQRCCSIKAIISYCSDHIDASKVKIKACGVSSILSWSNVSEYLAKLFTRRFCSKRNFSTQILQHNEHQNECRCDELEVAKDDFSSSTFESDDSTFLLRKNLRAILGVMFEEKKLYHLKYFFPQTNIFGWFKNQKKDKVAVKIPVNIDKDKKWMGLAIFAVFSISEKASCYCFEYEIQTKEKIISTQRFSIPTEVVEYSNRILFIVFDPRYNWYPYDELKSSSSNHVYINFNTNGARMRVELCGAHLVYQQNVEGLIYTIVNGIVGSGDGLYEYYNQQIVEYHLKMINSHWYKISFPQNDSVKNQTPTTASTCIASSLSVEHLLHGSFPHPFFHKTIQERFSSKFDLLLHGDEIPNFFTNQSRGNMIETKKLPHYLEKFRDSIGLAVCVLMVVDKKARRLNDFIPERERYTKVVDLICKFKVDLYQIEPEHCHFISQQKLLSEYASQFIWLSYLPINGFDINWHYCTQFEVTVETSCDELLGVQHCGLHLIHKHERMMIDRMIMESTVPSSTSHKGKGPQ